MDKKPNSKITNMIEFFNSSSKKNDENGGDDPNKIKRSDNLKNIEKNKLLNKNNNTNNDNDKNNNNKNNNKININNFKNKSQIITKEKDFIDDFEITDIKKVQGEENFEEDNLNSISKSDITLNKTNIDLWNIIPIYTPLKKATKDYMKSIMSSIVYSGTMFKDKLSESINSNIFIYNNKMEKFKISHIKDTFVYMSYRNGLYNTKFLAGNKNNYKSDCGWGCMIRCCQMMLSRAFIKLKADEATNEGKQFDNGLIKKEIIYLFYDKFINEQECNKNKDLQEIYKKLQKKGIKFVEIIPPYSIYILTLLGNCPNIFTSDHNMIKTIIKINKTLFNESIAMIHFNGTVDKKKVFENFCEKIDKESKDDDYIINNNEKYKFKKSGIIFISLRLGLQKIEPIFIDMIPLLFTKLKNNIGFVSGKKKKAYYFIGLNGNKLIFADPHFSQNIETNEANFPSYSVNELFLVPISEMSSGLTVGVTISSKNDLEEFFKDLTEIRNIKQEFIGLE